MKAFHLLIAVMFLFICLGKSTANAQNSKIDSLLMLVKSDKQDTTQVIYLNDLSVEYLKNETYDSSLNYGKKALSLAHKLGFHSGYVNALVEMGSTYDKQANYPAAIDYYFKALKMEELFGKKSSVANLYGNIGVVYDKEASYYKALEYYLKALAIAESLGDKKAIARHLGNIGSVYFNQGNYDKALKYYFDGLKLAEILGDKKKIASKNANIGLVYCEKAKANNDPQKKEQLLKSALSYYFKSLKINEESGEISGMSSVLGNIGNVYCTQGDYSFALDYYLRALKISEAIGDKYEMAIWYGDIGELYTKKGEFSKALKYLERASTIADSIGAIDYLMQFEEVQSDLYISAKQYERALSHYKKAVELRDTIFSQENKKELVRKELTYEFQKKELIEKAENEKKQAIAQEHDYKQKIVIFSVTAIGFLILLFLGFVFRSLRVARKQRDLIEGQKNEVMQQKVIVEKQKHVVEEHRKEIIDSITYAKRIQTALLTSDDYIKKHLPGEYFILFKPKDIVSGDFYWAFRAPSASGEKAKGLFYMATADCTGHGVPGAFMSMLNISYFNENVVERNVRVPNEILNEQREEVLKALNPPESKVVSKDGMDCVMCAYDFDKMELHFAAANNPLWLVRNNELIEYKADKMPVGKHSEETYASFTLQSIALQKGDIIYTSSDGYADQFGANNKKMMKKRFKAELLKIHQLPMAQQKEYLDKFFMDWKGEAEQVDDVCVIGVRI